MKIQVLLILLQLSSSLIFGQQYYFDVFNTQNSGLPYDHVSAIAIDNNGDKWVGTGGGGVARYDGSNWTVFNTQNSGLPDYTVSAIAIENNGAKWFGTSFGGIARFDGSNWSVFNTQNSVVPFDEVPAIALDNNGDNWFGTWGGGVVQFKLCPAAPIGISITPGNVNNACPLSPPTVLNANGPATHWVWSDGSTTNTIATPSTPSSYAISVTGYSGPPQACTASGTVSNTVNLQVYNLPANDMLCLVSVDTLTGKNQLIWNKTTGMRTDSFRIYKETTQAGVYDFAGNQSYTAFSIWSDQNSNPAQQSNRYYLSVLDSCGAESRTLNTPAIHRTIHLSSNQGINGENNLNWSPYEGITFSTYNIWRKNNGNPYVQIGSVPSTNLSFSDLTPPSGTNQYLIEVVFPTGCSPSSKTSSVPSSFSNAAVLSSGVRNSPEALLQLLTKVYPNPAQQNLTILLPESVEFQDLMVTDLQGKTMSVPYTLAGHEIQVDLSALPSGMWMGNIQTRQALIYKTFVKE